jgi:NCS1 family nucleobase:cation symporter-1
MSDSSNMEYETVKGSRMQRFKHAFSSPHAFHQAIILQSSTSILVNEDLLPSPPERQTWTTWNFFAYWYALSNLVSRLELLLNANRVTLGGASHGQSLLGRLDLL